MTMNTITMTTPLTDRSDHDSTLAGNDLRSRLGGIVRRSTALVALITLGAFDASLLEAARSAKPTLSASESLSANESRLAHSIVERRTVATDLLERVVNINSGTLNPTGVRQVADIFRDEFETLGFSVRWVDQSAVERAGHLIATRASSNPRAVHVLLIGHLDTVFEPSSPFQTFAWVESASGSSRAAPRFATGPGITDMKGGNVILLEVLHALSAAGALDRLAITAVLIGDEERSGKPLEISRRDLREAARSADFALGFEDGDGNPETAVISRRGAASWTLEVTGTPAHSSQIFQPEFGAGAIFEAARILTAFYDELSTQPNLTFNPGTILGGTEVEFDSQAASGQAFGKNNVIAERALVHGDLRALSAEQYEQATEAMLRIASQSLPGTRAALTVDSGYPPMAPTDGNRELLSMLDQASRDLGLGSVQAVDPRNAGAADISFVADLVPRALDGLGLMGRGGHTVNETADLDTLVTQAQRVALLLYRIAQR